MVFKYTAIDKNGKKISGLEESQSEEGLVERLQARGMVVVNVSASSETVIVPVITATTKKEKTKFSHKGVRLNDLLIFAHQLATMLESGVNLMKSLEIILKQVESKKLTDCLLQVKQDLERGSTLSNALAKHPKVFNQFWVSLVEVGEASGTLHIILERVATHLEEKAAFQGKIITAMLYPAVLLCVCIGAILIFSLAIIPKFTEIFKSFGIKVPPLTQALIVFFDFFRTKFLLIILIIGGIIYAIKMYIRTPAGRKQFETFLFKLPMFGNFYVVFLIERFTSQMSILVESGVPILYALEICQRMMGNKTVEDVIGFVKSNVREGKLIAEPMEKTGFFTPMVVQMVLIGEETGELSKMLKKVAVFYQNYVTTFTARVTSLFEPIMVVFMGFIVGTIVIAMFLPIFSIATAGGGAIR